MLTFMYRRVLAVLLGLSGISLLLSGLLYAQPQECPTGGCAPSACTEGSCYETYCYSYYESCTPPDHYCAHMYPYSCGPGGCSICKGGIPTYLTPQTTDFDICYDCCTACSCIGAPQWQQSFCCGDCDYDYTDYRCVCNIPEP